MHLKWYNVWQAYIVSIVLIGFLDGLPYENEFGPGYGSEWIMFVDDNGTSNVLNFSSLPTDERGLLLGEAYFYLYTRHNEIAETLLIPEDDSDIVSQYFNSSNDLKMITHGWISHEGSDWLQNMKTAFLQNYEVNIITIDWSELADNPIYPWSAFSTRYVGKRVAKMLAALRKTYQIEDRHVHLIGHSLGAQVMGYAGMFSDSQVNRITGLDPARPLFEIPKMGNNFRLDKTDAQYVDIIHTCAGIYGYLHSNGHADFYPNDGKPRQPGCEGRQEMIEGCSHGRSHQYFIESINSTNFVSYPCECWDNYEKGICLDNSTLMGLPASTDREGDFFLNTNAEAPYARAILTSGLLVASWFKVKDAVSRNVLRL